MSSSGAKEIVLLLGNSGTGKTHIALALGLAACQRGHRVRFTTAAALVSELIEARDEKKLLRFQKQIAAYELLIVDELGFVPLSKTGAELLFEMLSQRYERGSTMVTSNLPLPEWTEVLGSERLTGALLDRLTHHVHILEMNGDSYRLKQSRRKREPPPAADPPPRRNALRGEGPLPLRSRAPAPRKSQNNSPTYWLTFTPPHWPTFTPALTPTRWREVIRLRVLTGSRSKLSRRAAAENFLVQIREELVTNTYRPMQARKKEIPKDGGKKVRVLSIPAIRDRVVQGALKLILEPIFEADFQAGSFGYRPKRTAHEAVARVARAIVEEKTRIIDLDLSLLFR